MSDVWCFERSQAEVEAAADGVTCRIAGQMNLLVYELVEMVAEVLAASAWGTGGGLRSPAHWLAWKTGMSQRRAESIVRIAERLPELPACHALFRAGRLGEDAMAIIAQRCPPERDEEVAALAPLLMNSQLRRILAHVPEQRPKRPQADSKASFGYLPDGRWQGTFVLPPDEGALAQKALESARAEVFAERRGDESVEVRGPVTWVDAFMRLVERGLDALDPDTRRGEARGERAQVLVHLNARSDGDGSARIHLGPQLPDTLRRFLTCDAKVRAVVEGEDGAVLGISPLEPTVNPRLRRVIEQRDGGCRYPGCSQQRWVQVHHIVHREDGGLTVASNLCCLCPPHHRLHHQGAFEISGTPEAPDGLVFTNKWGRAIGPPLFGPVAPPAPWAEPTFTHPTGEPLTRWFGWN